MGYVTIDNFNYLRYSGELQICKKDLPEDTRVNVIGKIKDEELILIYFISDEIKFKFKETEKWDLGTVHKYVSVSILLWTISI